MSYNTQNKVIIFILSEERKSERYDDFALFSLRFSDFMEKVEKKSAKGVMSYEL